METIDQHIANFNRNVAEFFNEVPRAIVGVNIPVYFDADGKWCAVCYTNVDRFETLTGMCGVRDAFVINLGQFKIYRAVLDNGRKSRLVKLFIEHLMKETAAHK